MNTPYYQDATVTILHGDCLDVLRELPDCSVDAVVTDPPYSLSFMSRSWDTHATPAEFQQWCELWAAECLRVLKPGAHLLAFGGTRTWHRLAVAVEDAGFEMRDSIAWLYGSGFPKSLDVSKAIDKAAGAEREVTGRRVPTGGVVSTSANFRDDGWVPDKERLLAITAPATPEAEQWAGFGTSLKPAHEPICVARKPLTGTVAANVLRYGTGALNIDACRISASAEDVTARASRNGRTPKAATDSGTVFADWQPADRASVSAGRWPANVILDADQAAALDEMSGELTSGGGIRRNAANDSIGTFKTGERVTEGGGDTGGASRYFLTVPIDILDTRMFYTAKAGSDERITYNGVAHATVKPLSLMRYLVRLVTPPGGQILEPFAGSGTTVEAAILEGFRCIAIEREADYLPLITQRIHRRRDPVAYLTEGGHDLGLFGDGDEVA